MTFEFQLSDREFAAAWLAEYFRRPGLPWLRVLLGPAIAAFGLRMMRDATVAVGRIVGVVAILFGLWQALRPLLGVALALRRRRASGAARATIRLTIDEHGIEVSDGHAQRRFGWSEVTAAGRGKGYVWFEVRGTARGTIPLRAVADEAALVGVFRGRGKWT